MQDFYKINKILKRIRKHFKSKPRLSALLHRKKSNFLKKYEKNAELL